MIEVQTLSFAYGSRPILQNVSFPHSKIKGQK